ncbi:MAG: FkbM family methyltransferase [Pseudomonadota bacterium]
MYDNDHITGHFTSYGGHARPQLAMLLSLLRKGDVVIDAGAHIGSFAVPIANAIGPSGKLIAVEANPHTHAILSRNLERHGIDANAYNNGISDQTGERLFIHINRGENSGADSLVQNAAGPAVETITIDEIAGCPIDFIKIDVEGMEFEALKSARRTIDDSRPIIFLEYSRRRQRQRGVSPEDFSSFVRAIDYRVLVNLCPGQAANDRFEIAELADIGDLSSMSDLVLIPADSKRMPANIVPASSPKMRRYLLKQQLRDLSGIPKRIIKNYLR